VAAAQGAGTPTGTVSFSVDGIPLDRVALSNGQATYTTNTLGVGVHTVVATYNGDGTFTSSSSAVLSQLVSKAGTSTVVTSSADPSWFRQQVVFTAVVAPVAPGAGTPTGTVTFRVDGMVVATVNLVNGSASFSTSRLAKGHHVVTATYSGDNNFVDSSSPILVQTVKRHRHPKRRRRSD
jgi:hypothetical protein